MTAPTPSTPDKHTTPVGSAPDTPATPSTLAAPDTAKKKGLITARALLIFLIGAILAAGVGYIAWEIVHADLLVILTTMGGTFGGTVGFLHKIIES